MGDFISPLGLAGCNHAGKKQLLPFGQQLGIEWEMTSEKMESEKKEKPVEAGIEGREDFIRLLVLADTD